MVRVLLFGASWIAFVAALAVGLHTPGRPVVSVTDGAAAIAPPAPPPRAGTRYPGWTVTRAYSAHHTMIVEVEAELVTDSSGIATQLVEPVKSRYDEVLIYIREPGRRAEDLPARRIQWTPRAGYVELALAR